MSFYEFDNTTRIFYSLLLGISVTVEDYFQELAKQVGKQLEKLKGKGKDKKGTNFNSGNLKGMNDTLK